ncbi:MAG: AAA family ATPase, partial [Thiotrichaceae bacterium]|nr:AAA family ATPase [Thiotrichaceae bacterium]
MNNRFTIVTAVKDWQHHAQNDRAERLNQLNINASQAAERDLSKAAKRFVPSKNLLNAINASLAARVPLLLTGEPGTGKTQVAWYLQRFFNIPLYSYQVHSNSQANDMRYDFDAVAYLRDAYIGQATAEPAIENPQDQSQDPRANKRYLKSGALWKAYENQGECVLLIDEIDKAPRDFPNDLLQEL